MAGTQTKTLDKFSAFDKFCKSILVIKIYVQIVYVYIMQDHFNGLAILIKLSIGMK